MNALMTEHDLRQAVAEEGFDVHFQPIIDLSDGRVAGLEALARWPHPTHGMISPRVFIPLAEEVGLDIEISLWVLREACRQVRAWQEQSGLASLWLSVNFSSRLFHGAAVDKVAAILGDIGFEPHHLKLEIVEEVLEDESAIVNLQKLRDLGVHIHIDDFGHDATSPAYLRKLPADAIPPEAPSRRHAGHRRSGRNGGAARPVDCIPLQPRPGVLLLETARSTGSKGIPYSGSQSDW